MINLAEVLAKAAAQQHGFEEEEEEKQKVLTIGDKKIICESTSIVNKSGYYMEIELSECSDMEYIYQGTFYRIYADDLINCYNVNGELCIVREFDFEDKRILIRVYDTSELNFIFDDIDEVDGLENITSEEFLNTLLHFTSINGRMFTSKELCNTFKVFYRKWIRCRDVSDALNTGFVQSLLLEKDYDYTFILGYDDYGNTQNIKVYYHCRRHHPDDYPHTRRNLPDIAPSGILQNKHITKLTNHLNASKDNKYDVFVAVFM